MDVARKLQLKSAASVAVVDLPARAGLDLYGSPDDTRSALRFRPGSR